MAKKYLPFVVLLAAALLFYFIKKNQRGNLPRERAIEINVPAINNDGFNRNVQRLIFSRHARCRMECRHIDETEVMEILQNGQLNYSKIEEDRRGKKYPLEGITHDQQKVRIVFAPHEGELVVVTVIDLEKDWACNCGNQ